MAPLRVLEAVSSGAAGWGLSAHVIPGQMDLGVDATTPARGGRFRQRERVGFNRRHSEGRCMHTCFCLFLCVCTGVCMEGCLLKRDVNVRQGTSHAKAFRQWLVQTVGLCRLCQGCGVLDVAGGKGQLSFELLNLKAVPTTVVDPRPLNVAKYCDSFRMGHYGRQPEGAVPRVPRHIQRFWEPAIWAPDSTPPCPVQRQLKEAWERAHGAELLRLGGASHDTGDAASGAPPASTGSEGGGGTANSVADGHLAAAVRNLTSASADGGAQGEWRVGAGGGETTCSREGRGRKSKQGKEKPRFRGVFFDSKAAEGAGAYAACIRSGLSVLGLTKTNLLFWFMFVEVVLVNFV